MRTVFQISELPKRPWYPGSNKFWNDSKKHLLSVAGQRILKNGYIVFMNYRNLSLNNEDYFEYWFNYFKDGILIDRTILKKIVRYNKSFEGIIHD